MAKLSEVSPVKPVLTKKKKNKPKKNKTKTIKPVLQNENPNDTNGTNVKEETATIVVTNKVSEKNAITDEVSEKYPILKNQDLVNKFLGVTMTNNQKGRIRQQLKDTLKGTSEEILPEVIHNRIQSIAKDTSALTDAELRKIRILYNMLKTSIQSDTTLTKVQKKKKKKNKTNKNPKNKVKTDELKNDDNVAPEKEVVNEDTEKDIKKATNNDVKKEKVDTKKSKGPKRYVVFVGNLPLDIDKEKITHHFYELREQIIDIRIQKPADGKKSGIAYVELKNEPSYELALSKHHSMLNNRRINVLYTTQQNSKISKTEAKSKAAKLVALQKSGKLLGSVPINKKRSHRRMIAKKARAKLEAQS